MKYGYARVSTIHPDLEVQLQQLKKENFNRIFSEKYDALEIIKDLFNINMGVIENTPT
jgi:DNA invertase Pin-like site-specific DNA recombinase